MQIYFYDGNNRYVGNRQLNQGEDIPANTTITELTLASGKQAHFINGKWVISDIPIAPIAESVEPTTAEVLDDLIKLLVDKEVIY